MEKNINLITTFTSQEIITPINHCKQMINELKNFKGYSLSRIAKRCGVSPSTIRNIASGNVKTPRPLLLKKILILHCKVFNSDVYLNNNSKK